MGGGGGDQCGRLFVAAVAVVADGRVGRARVDLGLGGGLGLGRGGGRRAEDDVRTAVERLGAVVALPDLVDDVAARAVGEGAGEVVVAVVAGTGRGVAAHRGRVQVRPLQRLRRVEALLGDVHRHRAQVGCGDAYVEVVGARGHVGGGPVGAGPVQGAVLLAVGGAELPVGDDLLMSAVRVGDVHLVPVVERLGPRVGHQVLADLGLRRLRALGEAGAHPADRAEDGAVRARGGGRQGDEGRGGYDGGQGDAAPGRGHGCSLSYGCGCGGCCRNFRQHHSEWGELGW
nr:hypothetical protein [Streptomyces globisporus]